MARESEWVVAQGLDFDTLTLIGRSQVGEVVLLVPN